MPRKKKKTNIQYTDKRKNITLDNLKLESPFQPFSNDPKAIAEIIDKIVESKEFREELFSQEEKFVNQIADPIKCAEWWDDMFEKVFEKYGTIQRKSSPFRIKLRMLGFLIGNRLYVSKIKNLILKRDNIYEGQTLYNS